MNNLDKELFEKADFWALMRRQHDAAVAELPIILARAAIDPTFPAYDIT